MPPAATNENFSKRAFGDRRTSVCVEALEPFRCQIDALLQPNGNFFWIRISKICVVFGYVCCLPSVAVCYVLILGTHDFGYETHVGYVLRFLDTLGYVSTVLDRFFRFVFWTRTFFGYAWIRLDTVGYVWIRLDTFGCV